MGKGYKLYCKDCDVLSKEDIGSGRGLYGEDVHVTLVPFIQKHWLCKESIRIVDCDTYMSLDYRMDDCKPTTVPYWDPLLRFTESALEEEIKWESEWKKKLF